MHRMMAEEQLEKGKWLWFYSWATQPHGLVVRVLLRRLDSGATTAPLLKLLDAAGLR